MIGDNIKRIRKSLSLTQQQLSEISGVDQRAISRYECGTFAPTIATAKKIAAALGVRLEELSKEDDEC
jgi:transcriptional regulator with XRE-family HTH domain